MDFNTMTEEEARKAIVELSKEYYKKYHVNSSYQTGDHISYAKRVYDENEIANLVDSSLEFWLTSGRYTEEFESKFSKFLGVKYTSLVNSGSSANLLAFMTLTSDLLGKRRIVPGDEVITVAAGFPTTVTPIIQYGAIPVFVDITVPEYNIDTSMLESALSSKTKAVMIAHTLGNPFDLKYVREFCDKNKLWLIEDNCDALGSKVLFDGKLVYTGTIGDIGTSSFYPPHHMTMGEGGAVYTSSDILNKIIRSMRDWGRDCSCKSGEDNKCGNRFGNKYGDLPAGYDHKYVYSHFGYNLKATDMQASIGVAQLDKIEGFIEKRINNFEIIYDGLKKLDNYIILPERLKDSVPSWFGFLITCKEKNDRNKLVKYLESNNIQTRMLFCGNLIKHPCFDRMREEGYGYRVVGQLNNTDLVMESTLWIGLYPGMSQEMIKYMADKIKEYFVLNKNIPGGLND